ncbi:hypothetical protein V8F20_008601 [Naviculisporaceae sp. PSN 640]
MIFSPALLAGGLGLLLQTVLAVPAPGAAPDSSTDGNLELVSILEGVHSNTPLVWEEVVGPDGTAGTYTDIPTEVWDETAARLTGRSVVVPATTATTLEKRNPTHCHGSGSWAKLNVLAGGIYPACQYLKNTPAGQTRIYKMAGYNSAGDSMDVYYKVKSNNGGALDASGGKCMEAMNWILNTCYGKNKDSRGGYVTWDADGNIYSLDPQTHNCNC